MPGCGLAAAAACLLAAGTAAAAAAAPIIDRRALAERHNVRQTTIDPAAPLTVGNGEFAFTADVTGLQTLNATYVSAPPLQTMSHWGWHRVPPELANVVPSSYEFEKVTVAGHTADYATNCTPTPAYNYLRENPHRINLARVFLRRLQPAAKPIVESDLSAPSQTLHLWNGSLASTFTLDSQRVAVDTAVHPTLDVLALRVCSPLIRRRALGLGVAFPYAQTSFAGGTDWHLPTRHTSEVVGSTLNHTMDNTTYFVQGRLGSASSAAAGAPLFTAGKMSHDWTVAAEPRSDDCVDLTLWFSREKQRAPPPSAAETFAASATAWASAWQSGAALELAGSTADGAAELERRVVLSQYIMMSQEAGTMPPQETGLMTNSWYGKFHLEMRWHHSFHFLLWGRGHLAQRADGYFQKVREPARQFTKERQGYAGVRWPKVCVSCVCLCVCVCVCVTL